MKNWLMAGGVLVLVVIGYLYFGTNTYGNNPKSTTTATTAKSTAATVTDKVTIKDMAFTPNSISVIAGTSVTWTNNDSMTHTITESDGQTGPDSGDIAPGSTYTFKFTKAGTYKYHCTIHSSMTGTVTVTP